MSYLKKDAVLSAVKYSSFNMNDFEDNEKMQTQMEELPAVCKYAVVVTHTFDSEADTYLFDEFDMAASYLHWLWEEYYNEEIANESELVEKECYHELEYAVVTWTDGCKTEFALARVLEPDKEFLNGNWSRYL